MPDPTVNLVFNAKDNTKAATDKVQMSLKDMGEKTSMIGQRMTVALTAPIVGLGALVLKNADVQKSLVPITTEITRITSDFATSFIPVIQQMMPEVLKALTAVDALVLRWSALPPETKKVVLGIAGVVAALGPLTVAVGEAMKVVGTVKELGVALGLIGPIAEGSAVGVGALAATLGPILALGAAIYGLIQLLNSDFGKSGILALKQLLAMAYGAAFTPILAGNNAMNQNAATASHFLGVPGFANGGSFAVSGSGGTDSQLVRFMATPGEIVNVGKGGGGDTVIVNINTPINLADERSAQAAFDKFYKESKRKHG